MSRRQLLHGRQDHQLRRRGGAGSSHPGGNGLSQLAVPGTICGGGDRAIGRAAGIRRRPTRDPRNPGSAERCGAAHVCHARPANRSPDFPGFFSPTEYQSDRSEILDRAIRANVVINSLDARGLWVDQMFEASQHGASTQAFLTLKQQYDHQTALAQSDVLAEMADGTGGSLFENNNDLDQGMRELAGAPEYHYVIGFAPQNLKLDGSFHSLKVTVKTTPPVSLNVQARKGYYAPKKASNAEETARGEIEASVFSRDELSELPVELHTQFFKASEKDATISVVCRMDTRHIQFKKAGGRNSNSLTVVSAVFDRNGNFISGIVKTVDFNIRDETRSEERRVGVMTVKTNFSVPPGSYMIRLVVRDSEGQLMSGLNGAVTIP